MCPGGGGCVSRVGWVCVVGCVFGGVQGVCPGDLSRWCAMERRIFGVHPSEPEADTPQIQRQTSPRPRVRHPPNGHTETCKNITLSQTLFADGNKDFS